jgi:hypothetical protein
MCMELSLFLAQLFGLTLAIFAGIALFRPGLVRGAINEFGRSKSVTWLYSLLGIIGGLSVVLTHNVWIAGWPVIITIFGWAALIKGVLFLVSPALLRDMGLSIYDSPGRTKVILLLVGLLGLYLAGVGFHYF